MNLSRIMGGRICLSTSAMYRWKEETYFSSFESHYHQNNHWGEGHGITVGANLGEAGLSSQDGDMNTDVLIIGGGMAGILCAHQLHCAGVPYVLAEAETICSGITKNTTAKITSQHGLIYDKLISRFGVEQAKQYLDANEAALQTYRELCRNIDCGFEEKAAYTYSLDDRRKIERELEALDKLGFPAEFVDKLPLPFHVAGAVRFPDQAQFHPLKFAYGIAKGLHIYEHTRVRELMGTTQ